MNQAQLKMVLIGIAASVLAGTVLLVLLTPPAVIPEKRLAKPLPKGAADPSTPTPFGSAAPDERVNIEGKLEVFDGKAGPSSGAWPGFRGSDRRNVLSDAGELSDKWGPTGPPALWSVKLSEGHSGAAVWNGRVYLMDYDEQREADALRCFSFEDGKEIWRRWYKAPTKRNHGVSRTVPAVTAKFTVSMGPRCHVLCVDTESGAFRWGIDLVAEYGAEVPLWYTGQCPLIDEGVAVLAPAGAKAFMIGVECASGKVLWKTPNPPGWKMSHSSVMPMTLLGKKMYVYAGLGGVAGVSAEGADRGALLWKSTAWIHSVLAPSPVAVDDRRIFLTAGYGGGSMMLQVQSGSGGIEAKPLFELPKTTFACEQQSPIFYEGKLFGILPKDAAELRGQFVCLDLDGKMVWSSGRTERFGLGPFLVAGKQILILNDTGELTLIRASLEKYEQLARAKVLKGRDAWAPMALVDGKLLLRDSENLVCLDLRPRS